MKSWEGGSMTRGDEAISKSRLLSSDKGTDRSIIISTFQQKLFFLFPFVGWDKVRCRGGRKNGELFPSPWRERSTRVACYVPCVLCVFCVCTLRTRRCGKLPCDTKSRFAALAVAPFCCWNRSSCVSPQQETAQEPPSLSQPGAF